MACCLSSYTFFLSVVLTNGLLYNIDDSSGVERRFDGIGGISGGGATSRLLVNYPEPQRSQILDYLFKPNFGASLHILKVEIGGDAQSTDGSESSHMHNSWDENYNRGYEWWLMKEAKKRNPDILLYGLPWAFPEWIGQGTRSPYANRNVTADYIIRWIEGAKKYHNLTIDIIGIWNEKPYDAPYIKALHSMLKERNLSNVHIIATDNGWYVAEAIREDKDLAAVVDYIGVHYPGTLTTSDALATGKPLWSSEDYSTYNDNIGGGCWAKVLNRNYVEGYMTSTISWDLIASYYPSLPGGGCGLMTAEEPWSGHYEVPSPIWMSAHTTQFVQLGWFYLKHGSGVEKLSGGGTFVSLTTKDRKHLTIIVETMTFEHSNCIRPAYPPFVVVSQNVTFQLSGNFSSIKELSVWYSKLGFGHNKTTLFEKQKTLQVVSGQVTLQLGLDEVYTLTTLTSGQKGNYSGIPKSKNFPVPYTEDFESYPESGEPNNFAQQIGAFEVHKSESSEHGNILRQMVLETPIHWCPIALITPLNIIGNNDWNDIYIEVEAHIGNVNATDGVFVAARVQGNGCSSFEAQGIFFFIFPNRKEYAVTTDLVQTKTISSGKLKTVSLWNKLALLIKNNIATGTFNGEQLFNITLSDVRKNGFAAIGSSTYGLSEFDNFAIKTSNEGEQQILKTVKTNKNRIKDTLYFDPHGF